MKNLIPHQCNYIDVYKDIANSRRNGDIIEKININSTKLENRIHNYEENTLTLEKMVEEDWDEETAEILKSFFKKRCVVVDKLRKKIKQLTNSGICPYCGISEASAVEHYLPITKYPEFSVLTINLFPVCSQCNSYKTNDWINASGHRLIINYYYDPIETERFLYCDIIYDNGIPKPEFCIRSNSVTELSAIYRNHFSKLNLSERYAEISNSTIVELISLIKNYCQVTTEGITVEQLKKIILDNSSSLRLQFGDNHWKAALFEGLANCDEFISDSLPIISTNTPII